MPTLRVGPDTAAVRLDDGLADRQAHAAALRLGGEERIKDLIGFARRQPGAGVVDRNLDLTVLPQLRFDREDAACVAHCFNAVEHQVHQNLLDLDPVSNDAWNIVGEIGAERDSVPRGLTPQQLNHLADNLVHRH